MALLAAASELSWAQNQPSAPDKDDAQGQTSRVVAVEVVEIAGGRAFIKPGEDAGLRRGTTVTFGRRTARIIAVTANNAVIELGDITLAEGDRGQARVMPRQQTAGILAPTPLDDFRGQWAEPVRPADNQQPQIVPLGSPGATGAYQVVLTGSAAAIIPSASDGNAALDPLVRLWLGARVHAQPWQELPFSFDADVAVYQWLGRDLNADLGIDSRPLVQVRELVLGYRRDSGWAAGLGRLRYAASTLGLLDGVRLQAPLSDTVSVRAFGGVVPDPRNGRPAFDNSRFGVEAAYEDPESAWRPVVNVVAQGSMFSGTLDERRLSAHARAYRGPLALLAYAELANFASDNPWGAAPVEVTAAGIDAQVRIGRVHAGARVDMRQPERSLWLASLLPPTWLCTPVPQAVQPEPCDGGRDVRYGASLDAGIELEAVAITAGATAIGISNGDLIEEVSAFADLRTPELFDLVRFQLGFLGARSAFLDTLAARAGAGVALLRDLDISVYYRPALLSYVAAIDEILEHRIGSDILYMPLPGLDIAVTAETTTGLDAPSLGVFTTVVWRPRL